MSARTTSSTRHAARQARDERGRFQPRPKLSLVKTAPAGRALVLVKPRPASPELPARTPASARPEHAPHLAHAAHAATKAGIPARILNWALRPDGTVYQYLPDGTLLTHPGTYGAPLTALTTCTHGAAHVHLVTSRAALYAHLETADYCTARHARATTPAAPCGLAEALRDHPTTAITRVIALPQKPQGT